MPSSWTCTWCGAENPWPHLKGWDAYEMACAHCEAKHEFERGGHRWISFVRVSEGVAMNPLAYLADALRTVFCWSLAKPMRRKILRAIVLAVLWLLRPLINWLEPDGTPRIEGHVGSLWDVARNKCS